MSASYDLFCRWKHVQKIHSDNAGALALGITRASVSSWKKGKNAEIQLIERMAQDIGEPAEQWAASVMAERSNSDGERNAWQRIAQKLGATAALGLIVATGTAQQAAHAALPGSKAEPLYTLCEVLSGRPSRNGWH